MRKFLTFIVALVLALLLIFGVKAYREGVPLSYENLKSYYADQWNGFWLWVKPDMTASPPPAMDVEVEVEDEANLSYAERMEKGNYFFKRGFLNFAANEYVKATHLEPSRIEPYSKLLQAYFELGDYQKAQRNAETILKLQPNHFDTQLALVRLLIKQSEFEGAESLAEQLARSHPDDPQVLFTRALLRLVAGDHESAEKLFKQAKVASTDAELSKKIDNFLSAYTEFNFNQAAEPLYREELLARSLNQSGEYEMAIFKLKDVLRQRSDLRDAWVLLGFSYLNLEKSYFALTAFERAYELDPEWPVTQYFLGVAHTELGQPEDAALYFNYALQNGFEPAVVIHRKLADLYLDIKDYAKSVESYKKVLEITRDDVSAFVRPIWIYLDFLNQPEEALKLAEDAIALFPENPLARNLLGWSQVGAGQVEEAEKNLKLALDSDPNMAAAHFNLGKLYEGQGRIEEALAAYQRAYEIDQNGSIGNLAAKRYNELLTQ